MQAGLRSAMGSLDEMRALFIKREGHQTETCGLIIKFLARGPNPLRPLKRPVRSETPLATFMITLVVRYVLDERLVLYHKLES